MTVAQQQERTHMGPRLLPGMERNGKAGPRFSIRRQSILNTKAEVHCEVETHFESLFNRLSFALGLGAVSSWGSGGCQGPTGKDAVS
jgi:hypothetical protein